jgi:hypothetical protein
MRRCPSCQTVYTDPEQKFCLNDGTQLVEENAASFDPQATLVASGPPSSPNQSQPTQSSWPGQQSQGGSQWAPPPPPPQYNQPPAQKKSKLPWILGGLVLAVVVIGIIGVIGVVVLFASLGSNNSDVSNVSVSKSPANVSTRNSNLTKLDSPDNANISSSTNGTDSGTTSAPSSNEDEVLAQLTELEQDWNRANFQADREALKRILADEYVGVAADGTSQNKAEYLKTIRPTEDVKTWELQDLNLSLSGETAVLTGSLILKRTGGKEKYTFIDTFVWRDGRWQATGSTATPS